MSVMMLMMVNVAHLNDAPLSTAAFYIFGSAI